jgi:hypothetical protein
MTEPERMEKSKGITLLAVALILCVLVGGRAAGTPSSGADLIFLTSDISPVPATPGGDLLLNIITQNWGLASAKNVVVSIQLPDDLSLQDPALRSQEVGPLCSFCNVETEYSMKVSERAITGEYKVKILATWDGGSRDKDFFLSVRGTPKLAITNVNYDPAEIEPGKTTTITMSVKDIGSAAALNGALAVTLPVLTGDAKSGFSIIGAGTEIPVGTLGVGDSATVSFKLAVDEGVAAGVYNFPINISFSGGSSQSGLGLVVISKATLSVPKVQTDPVTVVPGKTFLLSATVENTGKNEAKSVVVNLINTDPKLSGATSSYLGTIKAGDKDVALFEMTYAGPAAESTVPVAFKVSYSDDFGTHELTEKGDISVDSTLAASAGSVGLPIGWMVAGAIALVAVWLIYFRKKGKKHSFPGGGPKP